MPAKPLTGAVLILLISTCILKAAKPSGAEVLFSITADNRARMGCINQGDQVVRLELSDEAGTSVFSKKIDKHTDYFTFLDLKNLPSGIYILQTKGNDTTEFRAFRKTGEQILAIDIAKEISPQIFHAGNLLQVAYQNLLNNTVKLSIEAGTQTFFSDSDNSGSVFTKKYSLEELPRGKYNLKIETILHSYIYPIELK